VCRSLAAGARARAVARAVGPLQHQTRHVDRIERVAQVVAQHCEQLRARGFRLRAARVRDAREFAQHHPGMGDDAVFPRARAAADRFNPGVEGAARRQSIAHRAGHALVRLAAPGHFLDLFRAQEHAPACWQCHPGATESASYRFR